jgi:hypothetical protein
LQAGLIGREGLDPRAQLGGCGLQFGDGRLVLSLLSGQRGPSLVQLGQPVLSIADLGGHIEPAGLSIGDLLGQGSPMVLVRVEIGLGPGGLRL